MHFSPEGAAGGENTPKAGRELADVCLSVGGNTRRHLNRRITEQKLVFNISWFNCKCDLLTCSQATVTHARTDYEQLLTHTHTHTPAHAPTHTLIFFKKKVFSGDQRGQRSAAAADWLHF